MTTRMMGVRRAGPRPKSTSPNSIKNFYNTEQGRVFDILRPNSMSFPVTPTIYSSGGSVDSMEHISNSSITVNIISWKSQQSTTFNLVMGGIMAGMIPIYTYPFKINSCYPIARGRVAGLLWTISTYINIYSNITRGRVTGHTWPASKTSAITWGRVAGLLIPMSITFTTSTSTWGTVDGTKRPMSTHLLIQRHFNNFFRNFVVVVTTAVVRVDGITILRT